MSNKEQELRQFASDLVTNASNGLLLDYCKLIGDNFEIRFLTPEKSGITIRLKSDQDISGLKSELANKLALLGWYHEAI
jgi:hypothetical protein|nr:MAG TPA: hypothetical protein [Caudoviricetes sp.]